MKDRKGTEEVQDGGRRDLLADAGRMLLFGATGAALSACAPADAPAEAPAAMPASAEDSIGARCVTVLYPNGDDATFDFDYYRDRHLTMIMELYGAAISRFELRKGLPGPDGAAPPYLATITIWIADMDAFAAAAQLYTQRLIDDVPNFTNTMPVIQEEELFGLGSS